MQHTHSQSLLLSVIQLIIIYSGGSFQLLRIHREGGRACRCRRTLCSSIQESETTDPPQLFPLQRGAPFETHADRSRSRDLHINSALSRLPLWFCLKSAVISLSQRSDMQYTMDDKCRVGANPVAFKRTKWPRFLSQSVDTHLNTQ